jgi:TIR domain
LGGILRSIFVNYRRSDSGGEAGRLFDDLTLRFSPECVFMDVAAIEPGRDFRKAIDRSVETCSVLLALIGQEWLDLRDSQGGRRLDDANDFVRIELASALRRDIPVVPVLVRGAKMPHVEQLPDDLKELAYRNAVELTHARWKSDVQLLLQALRPYLDVLDEDTTVAHREDREKELCEPVKEVSGATGVGTRSDAAAVTSKIEPQTMERVIKELAAFIGPISEVVVKRAAKRCSSVEDLYGMAAREIETEADRAKFLRSCRS